MKLRAHRLGSPRRPIRALGALVVASAELSCGSVDPSKQGVVDAGANTPELVEGRCESDPAAEAPDYLQRIDCNTDFLALASDPMDPTIPGARSVKVVLDMWPDPDEVYFQNSKKYTIHYEFASEHLSVDDGLPLVRDIFTFNDEYYVSDRRFMLGAVTYYEGPGAWVLEIAPYDTATVPLVEKLFRAIKDAAYFGPVLGFHPTSEAVGRLAEHLPELGVPVVTTDDLYEGIDYQPLNLGTAKGYLRFVRAAQVTAGTVYLGFKDIAVLDSAPNDITAVMGIITSQFQTPLSHVNVLSQNRGTPNMGLRNAWTDENLRALADRPVALAVGGLRWSIEKVTPKDVDAWWEQVKPAPVNAPRYNTEVTELKNVEDIVVESDGAPVTKTDIRNQIPTFGGKAAHYSVLAKTANIIVPQAFAVPMYYYDQFVHENGFDSRIQGMLDDPTFMNEPATRARQLAELRRDVKVAPVNAEFQGLLRTKLEETLPGVPVVRFRSSTNSEDLEGFTGAGLYESNAGVVANWESVLLAVRSTWAATWLFQAFEERSYRSIPQTSVGMALLVHRAFTDELANGVGLTANPFDTAGVEPAFYVNVQLGSESVVLPEAGVTTDQFLYFFDNAGTPTTYLSHSSLVPEGETVLSPSRVSELAKGLKAIRDKFDPAYGWAAGNQGFYAMDVEFKLDLDPDTDTPHIVFKQARPHPGRGEDPLAGAQ